MGRTERYGRFGYGRKSLRYWAVWVQDLNWHCCCWACAVGEFWLFCIFCVCLSRWKNANVPKFGLQGDGFLNAILKNKCRFGTTLVTHNGCGFAKLGPFHRSLQKLITTKIVNNYIRWAEAPISSKPMLCTVDVPWFLRVEGQRSCRSPSYSLHHVCQKSKPQLATKHGFFNGIDCAYIACRRPSI
jgi:hypothetical protein